MSLSHEDARLLKRLIEEASRRDEADEYNPIPSAFRDMLQRDRELTTRQRAWVRDVYDRVFDEPLYENLVSAGKVPSGRPVKLLVDSMPKPLKPPKRNIEDE